MLTPTNNNTAPESEMEELKKKKKEADTLRPCNF